MFQCLLDSRSNSAGQKGLKIGLDDEAGVGDQSRIIGWERKGELELDTQVMFVVDASVAELLASGVPHEEVLQRAERLATKMKQAR